MYIHMWAISEVSHVLQVRNAKQDDLIAPLKGAYELEQGELSIGRQGVNSP